MSPKDLAKALVPPGLSPMLRWRLAVSIALLAILAWIAWAMSFLGVPGLARAGDVDELKGQIADVRASLIAERIDAVTASLCMENYDAHLLEYRRDLQVEYRSVTGHEHTSPPCEVLLKIRR